MITCPNCGKELEDGTRFCDECGVQIVEAIFCQNCGQQTSSEYAFCQYCGSPLAAAAPAAPAAPTVEAPKAENKLKALLEKIPKKMLMIGAGAVAALLVLIVVLAIALSGGKKNNYILYVKDKEMYFTQVSKIKPWQVTDNLVDSEGVENSSIASAASTIGRYVRLSEDGKKIFYVDRIGSNGISLYYRSATNSKKEAEKIDSNIDEYQITKDGKTVVYTKGEEGDLYIHDLKDKEKVATNVSNFAIDENAKIIIWMDKEDNLYIKKGKKDKEKLDSEIDNIELISEDFKTIWYTKEGSFYKLVLGKDKEKIASDIYTVLVAYESGEFYYLKSSIVQNTLFDYVIDDMADADAAMKELIRPEAPTYVYRWNYETDEAYNAALAEYDKLYKQYQTELETYNKNYEAWQAKVNRDSIRETLKNEKKEESTYTLYYNNGKEDKELTANYASGSAEYSSEKQILIYGASEKGEISKVKLSELSSAYDIYEKVSTSGSNVADYYIALGDNVSTIEQENAEQFWITADGKTVYFLDNVDRTTSENSDETKIPHGELYKMELSGKKIKKTELYDSDVYYSSISMHTEEKESKLLYYKNYKNGKGELYIEKEKVADDVRNYRYDIENDVVTCMTDWNNEKSYGTLKQWKRGKLTKIADDVHSYTLTPDGQVLYLKEYSNEYYKGDLYMFKGRKSKKIDVDVVAIVPIYSL